MRALHGQDRRLALKGAVAAVAALGLLFLSACGSLAVGAVETPPPAIGLYELRIYTVPAGKMDELDARFRDHTIGLFRKHGMTPIAFFHVFPLDANQPDNRLFYLMGYKDRAARDSAWAAFAADPEWQKVYADSQKNGTLTLRVENIFLSAAEYAPRLNLTPSGAPRHFELRTYTANPGKLEDVHARFRNHTMGIFSRIGMTNFMYWRPVADQPAQADKMVYMLAYPTPAARVTMWQSFSADPEWVKVRTESEKNGPLLKQQGGVVSVQLTPTDYSPLK